MASLDATRTTVTAFTRTHRRRPSFGAGGGVPGSVVPSAASAVLRPEIFERLWSAHAVPSAWARSFLPTVDTRLTPSEVASIKRCFRAAALATEHGSNPASAAADTTANGDEAGTAAASAAAGGDAATGSPLAGSAALSASGLRCDANGAMALRHVIASSLGLTWLVTTSEIVDVMRSEANSRRGNTSKKRSSYDDHDDEAPPLHLRHGLLEDLAAEQLLAATAASNYTAAPDFNSALRDVRAAASKGDGGSDSNTSLLLHEDGVLAIAQTVKTAALSRRPVMLDQLLGYGATSNDDPYASVDEITSAFGAFSGLHRRRPHRDDDGDYGSGDTGKPEPPAAGAWLDATVARSVVDEFGIDGEHWLRSAKQHQEAAAAAAAGDAAGALGRYPHPRIGGLDGLYDAASEEEAGDGAATAVTFEQFEELMAVDPWKATAARLFATLGGDAADPRSEAPMAPVLSALRRMLEHELPAQAVEAFLDRFATIHEGKSSIGFDAFEATVVKPLRRICAGELPSDGIGPAVAVASAAKGNATAGGSAGLMQMLAFQPKAVVAPTTSVEISVKISQIMRTARSQRERCRRIVKRTRKVFAHTCVLQDAPLQHLAKLRRRHILQTINMVTQRRLLNLSAANPTVERFLRALSMAAQVLKEHAAQCQHCRVRDQMASKPLRSETASTAGGRSPSGATSPAQAVVGTTAASSKRGSPIPDRTPPAAVLPLPEKDFVNARASSSGPQDGAVASKGEDGGGSRSTRLLAAWRKEQRKAIERGESPRFLMPRPPTPTTASAAASVAANNSKTTTRLPAPPPKKKAQFCRGGRSVALHAEDPTVPPPPVAKTARQRPPTPSEATLERATSRITEDRHIRSLFIRHANATAWAEQDRIAAAATTIQKSETALGSSSSTPRAAVEEKERPPMNLRFQPPPEKLHVKRPKRW